jgi:uncharacterized protein Smg (DUF494 family)
MEISMLDSKIKKDTGNDVKIKDITMLFLIILFNIQNNEIKYQKLR